MGSGDSCSLLEVLLVTGIFCSQLVASSRSRCDGKSECM